ncbi:ATP-dependent helicase [Paenibacillus swuensis]|uniref:ATP-dependent helicase n=1 Tax=Paenibacillus swuensis TaxID=1178515 RepID=A0A172TLI4_9BACL|nr:ATP-dependent DNA helicase [Paenibacillus swuensis]ANE47677.1 ATP-dependent helicase [Paenibacillus swuensis]
MQTYQMNVRTLVEYVYRSGSLDSEFRAQTSMIEGTKAHQKVQQSYGESHFKEVYLKAEFLFEGLQFILDGRCDGLFLDQDIVTIDEIKSTVKPLSEIAETSYPVHWAQAKCYAYMYALEHGHEQMDVQLTYVQLHSEERKCYKQSYTTPDLETFMLELLRVYFPYAQMKVQHGLDRNHSIKELPFPFQSYREGQRKFAGAVYQSIADCHHLFAKAPTGTGKTISTLFPSVKAIGEGLLQRVFYLTAKTITRTAAEEALALMERNGLKVHSVTITAKDKVCHQEEPFCQKEYCAFADGYYDRINEAMLDLYTHERRLTRDVIHAYSHKHRVCPFEFSLDAAYAADIIICDYNYIFDPGVSLKRMFDDRKKHTVLLIDEAHNLVDRAREMYSAELNKVPFMLLKKEYKSYHPQLAASAKRVNDYFIRVRKELGEDKHTVSIDQPDALKEMIEPFISHAEQELIQSSFGPGPELQALLLETYFQAQSYIRISKFYDERYVTQAEVTRSGVRIKLFCLDPSYNLQQMSKGYRSRIHFSATLSPLSFYMDMLGGGEEDYSVSIPSPFMQEQLEVRVLPLSTRYRNREESISPIIAMLTRLAEERQGNMLVFFPSYEYMNQIYEAYMLHEPAHDILIQGNALTEEERERFLAAFDAENTHAVTGFAVMGGIFSEGIDLIGDRLTCVVIIGVGLPQLNPERDLLKDYFNHNGKNGYDYAYVYPGMNKVLQAGGRLIRSEQDRGLLILVDDRYLQSAYQRLLPPEWRNYTVWQP